MKKIASILLFLSFFIGPSLRLHAINIGSSPPPATSPDVIATLFVENLSIPVPDYLEFYNQTGSAINLGGWKFILSVYDSSGCAGGVSQTVAFPSGWLLPKHFLTFDSTPAKDNSQSAVFNIDPVFASCADNPWLASIELDSPNGQDQLISIPYGTDPAMLQQGVKHRQRDNSPNSLRTLSGNFTDDYVSLSSIDTSLYSDPLYTPPASTGGLSIVELLPHASNCSPLDNALTCDDYVKIFNSGVASINLSSYRLRTSYGGNKSTASNTITLNGELQPGKYSLINTKNDGSPLSLTEGGGFVWLEDAFGAKIYKPVTGYPNASSISKVGWGWALDGTIWRWTSSPQPTGQNIFPLSDNATLSLSTDSSLQPCQTGQYRNPATNRCRSIITAISTSSSLKSCPAGQERNPATNRCRKSVSTVLGESTLNVADVAAPSVSNSTQWTVAGGTMALALGYAVYEWRQEIFFSLSDGRARLLGALRNLRN